MRKIMKKLLLLNIILVALSIPVQAASVQVVATNTNINYGSFSATPGGTTLGNSQIQSMISDPATAIYGNNSETDIKINYSVLDLDFGETAVFTGSGGDTQGADLVVYSLWSGYDYSFGLDAFATDGSPLSSYLYDVTLDKTNDACLIIGNNICEVYLTTTAINLYSNDTAVLEEERELLDGIQLGYISLFIGGDIYNGDISAGGVDAYSNFSLVGAFHTDSAVVVPLPLSAVLFSSGLALLGWVGRKKTH